MLYVEFASDRPESAAQFTPTEISEITCRSRTLATRLSIYGRIPAATIVQGITSTRRGGRGHLGARRADPDRAGDLRFG